MYLCKIKSSKLVSYENKINILHAFLIIIPLLSNAESVSPTFGAKIERPVDVALIEGKFYYDVVVEIDAAAIDDLFKDGVKITVKSSEGKKI